MKLKNTLPAVVWVLVGLLVISGFVFVLGQEDTKVFPSANSYNPSGTRAFYDLLAQQGYRVETTQDAEPNIDPKSVVLIGFNVPRPLTGLTSPSEDNASQPFLESYVSKGGKAALFCLSDDFPSYSDRPSSDIVSIGSVSDPQSKLQVNIALAYSPLDEGSGRSLVASGGQYGGPIASITPIGAGQLLLIEDGIIATNRFIGRNDNAEQVVRWLRTIAPAGATLLFYEPSFGNGSAPTVFTKLGAWSSAAWLQLIFLFVVIVYTLGKPFGYPDEERKVQRGARDLVDAVAQLYRRARAGGPALKKIYQDADHELRNRLKLPSDAPAAERDRLIPSELADVLHRVESWADLKLRPADALQQVQRLDRLMTEFLGERRAARRKKVS